MSSGDEPPLGSGGYYGGDGPGGHHGRHEVEIRVIESGSWSQGCSAGGTHDNPVIACRRRHVS